MATTVLLLFEHGASKTTQQALAAPTALLHCRSAAFPVQVAAVSVLHSMYVLTA
jgi:hypothetical protein